MFRVEESRDGCSSWVPLPSWDGLAYQGASQAARDHSKRERRFVRIVNIELGYPIAVCSPDGSLFDVTESGLSRARQLRT